MPNPAAVAYHAYRQALIEQSRTPFQTASELPDWQDLPVEQQRAWFAVAGKIVAMVMGQK